MERASLRLRRQKLEVDGWRQRGWAGMIERAGWSRWSSVHGVGVDLRDQHGDASFNCHQVVCQVSSKSECERPSPSNPTALYLSVHVARGEQFATGAGDAAARKPQAVTTYSVLWKQPPLKQLKYLKVPYNIRIPSLPLPWRIRTETEERYRTVPKRGMVVHLPWSCACIVVLVGFI